MRKLFPCGHRGRGQYCHRCEQHARQQQARAERRTERTSAQEALPVHAAGLPLEIVQRAAQIIADLNAGTAYTKFKGKRISRRREILSIPVGRRYRLVARIKSEGIEYLDLLSHEDYNTRIAARQW
jgi:hypothetical protein